MKNTAQLIANEVSTKRLYTSVKEISANHRIQVSPGFRDAAHYVCNSLRRNGIEANVLTYKADGDIWYLQNKMFKEWSIKEAYLDLDEPFMHLCNYGEEPISVCQKSYPVNFEEDGLEVFFMDKGTSEEAYAEDDLNNKIIFMHEHFSSFEWAFKKGARGFITDHIAENYSRKRHDLYHSLTYTSFWWKHIPEEEQVFGFVLSPCMGDMFEKIYKERKAQGLSTVVKGKVDSELKAGEMEVVEAILPGESEETVLLSSHLCHPKSSANDNASGCAANMEMLRVLKKLMDEGKLPRNKKTIKVIFMAEFTGTYAYLSDHDYSKMVGALNLDMVGGKQTRAYGPITLTMLPDFAPSIVQPLTHYCLDLAGRETENLLGDMIPLTHYVTENFTGGSDHTIFCHPDFNMPCCMLGQWPDRNYHTATDTIDVIDPDVLAFSTRVACNFAYNMANLSEKDLPVIFEYLHTEMAASFKKIHEKYVEGKISKEELYDLTNKKAKFFKESAESVKVYLPTVSDNLIKKELGYVKVATDLQLAYLGAKSGKDYPEDNRRLVKKFAGPVRDLAENTCIASDEVKALYKDYKGKYVKGFDEDSDVIGAYLALDTTVGEAKKAINLDLGRDADNQVDDYLGLLVAMDMIELK